MSIGDTLKARVAPKGAPAGNPVQEISARLLAAEADLLG